MNSQMNSQVTSQMKTLLMAWVSVAAVLLVAGCGGKTGRPSQHAPEVQAPVASPVEGEVRETTDESTDDESENGDSESADSGGNPDRDTSTVPQTDSGTTPTEHTPERPVVTDLPPSSGSSTQGDGPVIVDYDPRSKTPSEIYNDPTIKNANPAQEAAMRSASLRSDINGEPLYHSGSGQDRLYEEIKVLVDSESNDMQRAENQKFADEIGFTTFEVNHQTRVARITVNLVDAYGTSVPHVMTGRLDNRLRVRAGNLSAPPHLEIEAACMDLRGGCSTAHIRVTQGSQYGTRTAHVLARHTQSTIFSEGNPASASMNREYDRFVRILTTSVHYPGGANSIEKLHMTTSEVINGRSEFAITMSMRMSVVDPERAQTLTFSGPLVKPLYESEMVMPVSVHSGYSIYGRATNRVSQPIAATIRDAAMIRNDGRGNVQIDVTFRKSSAVALEDTVRLTFGRMHQPTRPLQLN